MKVLLLGATGLTGQSVLTGLLETSEVTEVVVISRRALSVEHSKLSVVTVEFERLGDAAEHFLVSVIICCLGTTIKQAGSKSQFRKVDYQYCLEAARIGRAKGVSTFILMSAIGASSRSSIFYNRTKGELEDALRGLNFDQLSIYHPSLLLGRRGEWRVGESVMVSLAPALNLAMSGPFRKYRAIEATTVARAMVNELRNLAASKPPTASVTVRSHDDIVSMANAFG